MGIKNLIAAVKEAGLRILVLMLALILVMLVASRSVEFELEQSGAINDVSVVGTVIVP